MLIDDLSGIVLNQNVRPENTDDRRATDGTFTYQVFYLPNDYMRGVANGRVPPLSGFQCFVSIASGSAQTAAIDWTLDRYIGSSGWTAVTSGTAIGAPHDGDEVWMTLPFKDLVKVDEDWLANPLRMGVKARTGTGAINQQVEFDATQVIVNDIAVPISDLSPVPLEEGQTYPFSFGGIPSILSVEPGSGSAFYSVQQGVTHLRYTVPNPVIGGQAFRADGATPITDAGRPVSLMFRVLGMVADSGTDFLGNLYRSATIQASVDNASTSDSPSQDSFYLSKPNPSPFGVESIYFDVRDVTDPVVIDRIFIDPLTLGVYFNVYYSNDPAPGTTDATWEKLLWTHVPQTYQMNRRTTYALPEPITCKYVKIEFSHLQARPYAPGLFQRSILYKKHPQWVFDYFAMRLETLEERFVPNSVQVVYDALDLAFRYYQDDIISEPQGPAPTKAEVADFLRNQNVANEADTDTLSRIRLAFRPFLSRPSLLGRFDYLLGSYLQATDQPDGNYSTEQILRPLADTTQVSDINREEVVIDKSFPVMSFFLTCRHGYRESLATFNQDVAYFAGIKEIAFTREHYAVEDDNALYIESVGDMQNAEANDFQAQDQMWVTYVDEPT